MPSETKCAYVAAKKLPNGDLIVSMRWPRTGNGRTWICDLRITQAALHPDCGHYNSILEIAPGRLLLCYGVSTGGNSAEAAVFGTFIEVSKL